MRLRKDQVILEADFVVEEATISGAKFSLVLESKNGQGRNPDYYEVLKELLKILASEKCRILEVKLASTVAMKSPFSERILPIVFPITLSATTDFELLRRSICRSQARTLTSAKTGSGNSHRRIRIEVDSLRTGVEIFGNSSLYLY